MPIIVDYKRVDRSKLTKVPHYTGFHQRQIIGQFENGDYVIITSERVEDMPILKDGLSVKLKIFA